MRADDAAIPSSRPQPSNSLVTQRSLLSSSCFFFFFLLFVFFFLSAVVPSPLAFRDARAAPLHLGTRSVKMRLLAQCLGDRRSSLSLHPPPVFAASVSAKRLNRTSEDKAGHSIKSKERKRGENSRGESQWGEHPRGEGQEIKESSLCNTEQRGNAHSQESFKIYALLACASPLFLSRLSYGLFPSAFLPAAFFSPYESRTFFSSAHRLASQLTPSLVTPTTMPRIRFTAAGSSFSQTFRTPSCSSYRHRLYSSHRLFFPRPSSVPLSSPRSPFPLICPPSFSCYTLPWSSLPCSSRSCSSLAPSWFAASRCQPAPLSPSLRFPDTVSRRRWEEASFTMPASGVRSTPAEVSPRFSRAPCPLLFCPSPPRKEGGLACTPQRARNLTTAVKHEETENLRDLRLLEQWFLPASPSSSLHSSCPPSSSPPSLSSSSSPPSPPSSSSSPSARLFVLVLNRPLPAYAQRLLASCTSYVVSDGGGNALLELFQKEEEAARRARQADGLQEAADSGYHEAARSCEVFGEEGPKSSEAQDGRPGSCMDWRDKEGRPANRRGATKLPEALCGDLDSLSDEAKEYFETRGVPVLWWEDQDLPDVEKAWRLLLAPKRFSSNDVVIILGAIGGRLDHTLCAIHVLYKLTAEHEAAEARAKAVEKREGNGEESREGQRGNATPASSKSAADGSGVSPPCRPPARVGPLPQIYLLGEDSLCFLVSKGRTRVIPSDLLITRQCALIPCGEAVSGVTTEGLRWNLTPDMRLNFGEFISTSNQISEEVLASAKNRTDASCGVSIDAGTPLLWYSQMRLQPSGAFEPPLEKSHES
ncbi:thiamin pyrophosphokinase, catalytic domain-containing protein [Toxoplasma gondii FOU]|uniref:Thiamin pyrophosphokinase, catalytic domain-containing protein n=3 Tax=Toxoplasma gondii TaxID=5811 RepID=A0A086L897_TOXGO|nr:thiamin pyrophosphokinase, catalytic domain-containing protein [Toxoplasma gondii FOU]PUA86364.1 thiamine pyrophosphokinase, catalytic domain-containing protein [Toxoplasma gondii TgCATBr9]RQX69916.1 thiamine pyrophosphokinase, catalytic domain-containing protein [Toxoplasma gondii CAST]